MYNGSQCLSKCVFPGCGFMKCELYFFEVMYYCSVLSMSSSSMPAVQFSLAATCQRRYFESVQIISMEKDKISSFSTLALQLLTGNWVFRGACLHGTLRILYH